VATTGATATKRFVLTPNEYSNDQYDRLLTPPAGREVVKAIRLRLGFDLAAEHHFLVLENRQEGIAYSKNLPGRGGLLTDLLRPAPSMFHPSTRGGRPIPSRMSRRLSPLPRCLPSPTRRRRRTSACFARTGLRWHHGGRDGNSPGARCLRRPSELVGQYYPHAEELRGPGHHAVGPTTFREPRHLDRARRQGRPVHHAPS
jgi:hypothetical protein